jgi:Glucose inhibited division protein A
MFADRAQHLPPLQGFSTGLPERLQRAMLRTLPGLEAARVVRPAYAVEYDFLPAYQCRSSLETRKFSGLFFSGQLNGTTGAPRGSDRDRTDHACKLVKIDLSAACYGCNVGDSDAPNIACHRV